MKMKTISSMPLLTVPALGFGIPALFIATFRGIISEAFTTDESGMSYIIVALFLIGVMLALLAAWMMQGNWRVLHRSQKVGDLPTKPKDADNRLGQAFSHILQLHNERGDVGVDRVVDSFVAKHESRIRFIGALGAILITLGLLGTIIGLLMSVQGLGEIAGEAGSQSGLSESAMKEGLRSTIDGMGTAFYTTLFGALLGGVVLRILAVTLSNSLGELSVEVSEFIYHILLPPVFAPLGAVASGSGGGAATGEEQERQRQTGEERLSDVLSAAQRARETAEESTGFEETSDVYADTEKALRALSRTLRLKKDQFAGSLDRFGRMVQHSSRTRGEIAYQAFKHLLGEAESIERQYGRGGTSAASAGETGASGDQAQSQTPENEADSQ